MLPELTKLVKITAVHCEHLSTHPVAGDGQQDALVRPGYQLSVTTLNTSTVAHIQVIVERKIVLYAGRPGNSYAHMLLDDDDDVLRPLACCTRGQLPPLPPSYATGRPRLKSSLGAELDTTPIL